MATVTSAWLCGAFMAMLSLQAPAAVTAAVDNVAFQWTNLYDSLFCYVSPVGLFSSSIQSQLHLAQWHALLALKSTGDCTTEEAVVAFASHKILSHYYAINQDGLISPLLDRQLRTLGLTDRQTRLGKRLGEAVARALIAKRSPAGEFGLGPMKDALNQNPNPAPGVFRYFNDTPRDAVAFYFHQIGLYQPFVIPHPLTFVTQHLADLKPAEIPSKEWDENYYGIKDLGRRDWSGRTYKMNLVANLVGCPRVNNSNCGREQVATSAAQAALPSHTSLYDSVTLLAKISVSIYDAHIVLITLKYGFWFWRPIQAFQAGDPDHDPIPSWLPYSEPTPPEPEYPSGTAATVSAGARPLQVFLGEGKEVAFTIPGGGLFTCPRFANVPVPDRHYNTIDELVEEAKMARLYGGIHFNKSVQDGQKVGVVVANYVEEHWTETTPSGVLPDPTFLDIYMRMPKKSGSLVLSSTTSDSNLDRGLD